MKPIELDPQRFPPPSGVHPTRWWWRTAWPAWVRTDGYAVGVRADSAAFWSPPPSCGLGEVRVLDGAPMPAKGDAEHPGLECTLAWVDAAYPLPAPPPRVGQVWTDGRVESMVTHVQPGSWTDDGAVVTGWQAMMATGRCLYTDGVGDRAFPPRGAVLISGPGAPWSPVGVRS